MSIWLGSLTVNAAGPATEATQTTLPVIAINLTDNNGTFTNQWFFAADVARSEMLAVALAAISSQRTVQANLDPPVANNNPFTQIYNLYINRL